MKYIKKFESFGTKELSNVYKAAIENRFVNLDEDIINAGTAIRKEISKGNLAEQTFLIVGFGTLGKVIFQVLMNLGYREGYIVTSKPAEAENFIQRSSHDDLNVIQVLDHYSKLPLAANIIFYTSSPKIEIETKENVEFLKELYDKVYHDELLSLMAKVEHQKLFYPSSTYIDSVPDDFQEYTSVKLKTELELKKLNNDVNSHYLILRLPPFTSRHHSILLKSQNEIGIEELAKFLGLAFKNWLLS